MLSDSRDASMQNFIHFQFHFSQPQFISGSACSTGNYGFNGNIENGTGDGDRGGRGGTVIPLGTFSFSDDEDSHPYEGGKSPDKMIGSSCSCSHSDWSSISSCPHHVMGLWDRFITVSVDGLLRVVDLKLIDPYIKVISHGGKHSFIPGTVQHGITNTYSLLVTVQYNTVQYSTVQYSTVQYSTVQYRYSTVQYSIIQYRLNLISLSP